MHFTAKQARYLEPPEKTNEPSIQCYLASNLSFPRIPHSDSNRKSRALGRYSDLGLMCLQLPRLLADNLIALNQYVAESISDPQQLYHGFPRTYQILVPALM